ncbi:MAG: TonB-dependent receptor [Acidobacteriaceae bacterium]
MAILAILSMIAAPHRLVGQSTFGSIMGTVTDSTGSVVPGATVVLLNTGTAAKRRIVTDQTGAYTFSNLDTGKYNLTITAPNFQKMVFSALDLQAREIKRVDAALSMGTVQQTVEVEGSTAGVITTEVSNLAVTKTGQELINLPVAIASRSSGSTSPISTLTTDPGVQTDDSGNLDIAGATPALLSVTIDGISSVNVESSGPINELFPSFNSISEIRVSETNNNAEFSGVADITTTSRAGTNQFHGGLFENHQNTVLNAGDPFTGGKPKIIMNNFGGYVGGPLMVPHLYDGHNKSFFFASYEGLRLPREQPLVASVPSAAMRQGNLCAYLQSQGISQVYNYDGTPLDCAHVPISTVAANAMQYLMPAPNTGVADAYTNNFAENFPAPISSNQGDLRLDQAINSKQSVFARFTYKKRNVSSAPTVDCSSFCTTAGSPSTGGFSQPETDMGMTAAYNYIISPRVVNEFRAGFNMLKTSTTFNVNSASMLNQIGIQGVPDVNSAPTVPNFQVNGFMSTGGGNPGNQRSNIIQALDNVTWTAKNHTIKFGADFRRMTDHDDNVFGNYRSGTFAFNGSSDVGAQVGDAFTQFLLGYPDYSILAQVTNPNMNGLGYSYAFFAQDDWDVTPSFTLNFGMRWEVHPPLKDTQYNTAAFDPDYYGVNGGELLHGVVVVPNEKTLAMVEPAFAASIAPTPILTAKQAGLPSTLRYTDRTDFGPRIGFAWRPFHNDKTVIRGGYGRFIETPMGFSLVSGWAVSSSYVPTYYQSYDSNGNPSLSFPKPFPANLNVLGTASFYYAFPIHYHDPSVQQWNLTFEHDLGYDSGLRLSYTGSHGANLETMEDLNQVPANNLGYAAVQNNRPFPIWGVLQSVYNGAESNYNSFTADVKKRMSNGLQFEISYVLTRDLSNEAGSNPSSFVGAGGNFLTDRFHPGLDYGNVSYDRRHRFLATYLYNLPFGRGQALLGGANHLVDSVVGGWQLGGVMVFQSGPFLTPFEASTDPAGTNMINVVGSTRADRVMGQPVRAAHNATLGGDPLFLNANAFAIPADNIGRFGNAAVGSVVGPGTQAISMSLIKTVKITESTLFQFGAEAANLLNHRNYEPPNMQVDSGGFGSISGLQTAEGAGPRNVELTGRITF